MTSEADNPTDELTTRALQRASTANARAQDHRTATAADDEAARTAKKAALINYAIAGKRRRREEIAAELLRERGWAVISPHKPRNDKEAALYANDIVAARALLEK